MAEDKFTTELPKDPKEGDYVWLSLGKPGFWSKQTFINGRWHETGGMACPYIPEGLK